MPGYSIPQKPPDEILTFEEITAITRIAVSLGINKIRITGGEPLMRRDLPRLLALLSSVGGLEDLSLTTNAILLKSQIKALKTAGLKRINISIDSLDRQKFAQISRLDLLGQVLEGIDVAIAEGLFVKLNVVILKGVNDDEILDFFCFAQEKKVILRFIELMPMLGKFKSGQDLFLSYTQVMNVLEYIGPLKQVRENLGNGPADYYKIGGAPVPIGFIAAFSHKFCFYCNRLRLTSDGMLMPCLGSRLTFDLKTPLRKDQEKEVGLLFRRAASFKPEGHFLDSGACVQSLMSQIGG
jgi:cyclic pyranopterin phosphate synthase